MIPTATQRTGVLIIGGGAAGVRAAIAAADAGADTLLVCKSPISRSGITITAGGGIQAPFHPDDSEQRFFDDVVRYGYGLADETLVEVLAANACERVLDLERYGVRFRKQKDGDWLQFQMPGQSAPRNVRLAAEGVGMMRGLRSAVLSSSTTVLEDMATIDLLQANDGTVVGASCLDVRDGGLLEITAGSVILATGGCQSLWHVTDCPSDATGDGLMLAYRCGAELVDLEMILFYPSVIVHPPAARGSFVHYEWLGDWACDGEILDANGAPVLPKPLPVRDVSMRMMWRAIQEGRGTQRGGLWWDVSASPKGRDAVDAFLQGQQYRYLRERLGIDPSTERIEVAPGAHYQLGGIRISHRAETNLPGLYAVPEVAGNVEGANRLSGSALAGTQVFGEIAGREAAQWAAQANSERLPSDASLARARSRISRRLVEGAQPTRLHEVRDALRQRIGESLGIERSAQGLEALQAGISSLADACDRLRTDAAGGFHQPLAEILELENMVGLAELIRRSALLREESRGHHFRTDFPERDNDRWMTHTLLYRDGDRARVAPAPVRRVSGVRGREA